MIVVESQNNRHSNLVHVTWSTMRNGRSRISVADFRIKIAKNFISERYVRMTNLGIIITFKVLKFNTYAVILPNFNSRDTCDTFLFFQSIS